MRTWAEINLNALAQNMKKIREITDKKAKILAVVKADAYGHGACLTSKTLLDNGADCLGVATLEEALQLKNFGIDAPILIVGVVLSEDIDAIVKNDIIATVFDYKIAKIISEASVKYGKTSKIHIKLDTGMTRIGFLCGDTADDEIIDSIIKISELENIQIDGIFSHFSKADEESREHTDMQFNRFMNICNLLEKRGVKIPCKHICNSAGIIDYPEYHLDMVRSGIICYGHYPSDCVKKERINLTPAMTWKSKVVNINSIKSARPVGYGGAYIADANSKIATVSVGYADGYSRVLSNKAKVGINGNIFPISGNICMDQVMADVTDFQNIKIGDDVILFGQNGNNTITVESVADLIGTISYELLCVVGKRVPRVYIQDGKMANILNYLV